MVCIQLNGFTGSLASWVECSPMVRETWVQPQVASYQKLLKWYMIPPCLTLSNKRYVSRVKWSNPGKGVEPSPTPRCCSDWKGSLLVPLDYGRQQLILTYSWMISIIAIYRLHTVKWFQILPSFRHSKIGSGIVNDPIVRIDS